MRPTVENMGMNGLNYLSILFLFFSAVSCTETEDSSDKKREFRPVSDSHSYANIEQIRTKHLHLDIDVNFDAKTISGVARHEMVDHEATTAIFDIKALDIKRVTLGKGNEIGTDFELGDSDDILGRPLKVKIKPDTKYINIYYSTTDETQALDWLDPALTSGKKHPFMYTQGQAILTRSWIPLQDSPTNRITYSADVQVPSELMAVMSADNPKSKSADGKYHFEMKQKIPAYLIAIAVGDLKYTSLGDRCGIYSEPELAAECAYEFTDLPKMINAAEKLYGTYQWDQFDMAILPYSFPFGGMENPRLTFANPTLLAGDQSLVSVVAHELAHSWSGNLVTNATWNDFWLNEGFTVYFENRIMEALYGEEIADIHKFIEFQDLVATVEDMENGEHPEDTHLKLHLDDRDPDEGMSDIAYVKGAFFLRTIEKEVGRKKFDIFIKEYFDTHAFETISTEDFVDYLSTELFEPNNVQFNVEEWIYQPGIPDNCVKIRSKRLEHMDELAQEVNNGEMIFIGSGANLERSDFITQEWVAFIRGLSDDISPETMAELDEKLAFSQSANRVIKLEWYQLAVRVGYKSARPYMKEHLTKVGRRWLIEGIYRALAESEDKSDLAFAKEVFEQAKGNYHFVSRSTVAEILGVE
ncbi:MAG: M1 family metallopeptidase [Crocinitomicaceae bacterium]|nr:M1 family metallopeptidase [Crocinitomicaceae bacterium]